jgi:hypothetical protein
MLDPATRHPRPISKLLARAMQSGAPFIDRKKGLEKLSRKAVVHAPGMPAEMHPFSFE